MMNELRKYLKNIIENATGWATHFLIAGNAREIPYITFEFEELLSDDAGKHIMEFTVDAWDKDTPYNVIEKVDALDKVFKFHKGTTDAFLVQIYLGASRQFIEDEDKTVVRLQRKYDLILYEKGV